MQRILSYDLANSNQATTSRADKTKFPTVVLVSKRIIGSYNHRVISVGRNPQGQ